MSGSGGHQGNEGHEGHQKVSVKNLAKMFDQKQPVTSSFHGSKRSSMKQELPSEQKIGSTSGVLSTKIPTGPPISPISSIKEQLNLHTTEEILPTNLKTPYSPIESKKQSHGNKNKSTVVASIVNALERTINPVNLPPTDKKNSNFFIEYKADSLPESHTIKHTEEIEEKIKNIIEKSKQKFGLETHPEYNQVALLRAESAKIHQDMYHEPHIIDKESNNFKDAQKKADTYLEDADKILYEFIEKQYENESDPEQKKIKVQQEKFRFDKNNFDIENDFYTFRSLFQDSGINYQELSKKVYDKQIATEIITTLLKEKLDKLYELHERFPTPEIKLKNMEELLNFYAKTNNDYDNRFEYKL